MRTQTRRTLVAGAALAVAFAGAATRPAPAPLPMWRILDAAAVTAGAAADDGADGEPGTRTRCNGGGNCCKNHPGSDACAPLAEWCQRYPTVPECAPV
ncbi:MAG: hypothetical protein LC789_14635 [Actinobacteria bacterium]|nr:hypothetical protein [Actinomycetota bacterium]